MKEVTRFEVSFNNVEKINPLFSRASIRVLYEGLNRNNSHISREVIEKALPSIFNIPIVGEYLEDKDNFGGHGGKLEITDNDIKYVQTTKPYGVVPESANIHWETITEKTGEVREYLTIDGAYLWTGRYEELDNLLERSYGQSMEIEVVNADFAVIDGVETFDIKEFLFSALCILGVNKDGEGHVEPAFESASITTYSLDKTEFKKQFNQMIAELKFSLNEGGNEMPEEMKNQETEAVEEVVEETAEVTEVVAKESEVKAEEVSEEAQEEAVEATEEQTEETEVVEEFDYKAEYEKVKDEYDTLKAQFEKLEGEVESLKTFKAEKLQEERKEAEEALFARFSAELAEEEINEVKEVAADFSIDQLEEKLYVMVGKKKATFSAQPKKEVKSVKVELEKETEEEYNPYALLKKYQK